MSKDISTLSGIMERVIDLGGVDRWMRDMSLIVPQAADLKDAVSQMFNKHTFSCENHVTANDVQKMNGFRQLLSACSQRNIAVEMRHQKRSTEERALEVEFFPDKPFSKSRIFGSNYTNVMAVFFSEKRHPETERNTY